MKLHLGITIISLLYAATGVVSVVSVFLSMDVFSVLDVSVRTFDNLLWAYLPYAVLQFTIAALLMCSKNISRVLVMILVGFAMIFDVVSVIDGNMVGILWLVLNAAVILYLKSPGVVQHYAVGKTIGQ